MMRKKIYDVVYAEQKHLDIILIRSLVKVAKVKLHSQIKINFLIFLSFFSTKCFEKYGKLNQIHFYLFVYLDGVPMSFRWKL
jgi:hypothetical protein